METEAQSFPKVQGLGYSRIERVLRELMSASVSQIEKQRVRKIPW